MKSFCLRCLQIVPVIGFCCFASVADAQSASAQSPPRETIATGVAVTPALEGGGPWLLAGAKANSRLSERFGVSVEASRIWGSKSEISELTQSYTASMLIYARRSPQDRTASY
jgi:hypothetical protein